MAFEHTVHDATFRPYPEGEGPQFHLRTWYAGVAVTPSGQSTAKLGYCLRMDDIALLESPLGQEDYLPAAGQPFEGEAAMAFLMGYLTNDFLVGDQVAAASGERKAALERYQTHLVPLWDYLVQRYGEAACYGY